MKYFDLKYIEERLQDFNEICRYSCSRNGEVRTFNLFKTHYILTIWKFEFKVYRKIKIQCTNCGKTNFLPNSFAKTIFKNGLKSNLLLRFANDRVLSSWILNFLAKSWILFGILLVALSIFIGVRFFVEPVQTSDPVQVTFDELQGNENLGKIVKLKGKVDYTLAFTKDEIQTDNRGNVTLSSKEVYLPIFSEVDPLEFVVIKGGDNDLSNVLGRANINSSELLRNQDYEVTGKVETISNIQNERLRNFYLTELPKDGSLNTPQILINSSDIVSSNDFINRYLNLFLVLLVLTIAAVGLNVYIDRKITEKSRN